LIALLSRAPSPLLAARDNIIRKALRFDNSEMARFSFQATFSSIGILPVRRLRTFFALLLTVAVCAVPAGCAVVQDIQNRQAKAREESERAELRKQALVEHAVYRSVAGWRKQTYRNRELLSQATAENVSLEISLSEQRGLLLVRTAIAMDFPVATGKKSHPTPAGSFTIRSKEKNYFSNLYGKIYDAQNVVLVGVADARTDLVPEGGRFEGAMMPYWMRLTDTGVGLHVGYVPGRPASHGCIRIKRDAATEIFDLVKVGTPVVVAQSAPSLP
jgi:lipoprotein-anchoring transpeptidase ErfK/SrfK